ncbi:MAG: FliA/WhiG family RNA polymerase sigma factor [Gemmatimonadaceae bacterium]|nr:FliA/WhiG family RNA polymerase sigma factor [Gemmatimonadaceae bacterium]
MPSVSEQRTEPVARTTAAPSLSLWSRAQSGDELARNQLLNEHLGLVHYIARQLARGRKGEIELDELLSAGALGLTAAVDSFDASRGLAFSTFAAPRIRGAILDELRRQDHVPRSVRRKTREIKAASEALNQDGEEISDDAMATRMGVDLDTFRRWQLDVEGVVHVSLDSAPRNGDEDEAGPTMAEQLAGSSDEDIEEDVNRRQEIDVLAGALTHLKEQERLVLTLYFYEDLKLHEIAIALGVSESRVSQIRTKALAKLRTELAPMRGKVA